MSVQKPTSSQESSHFATRHLMVLLVFGCRFVQTVMRMAVGALVVYICEGHSCSTAAKGWILSAHAFGYCTTQILGGVMAGQVGGCYVTGVALALAGLALAVTPIAVAMLGLWGIVVTQIAMGVAMGPLFPATMQVLTNWLPPSERALVSAALDAGVTIGSLMAVQASGSLAVCLGWGAVLTVYGLAAVAFSAVWVKCVAEQPEQCSHCGATEQAYLASQIVKAKKKPESTLDIIALLECLRYIRFWAIYIAHFAFNYSVYFVNSWAATYYLETFAMRPEHAGLHLSLPHAANILAMIGAAPLLTWALRARGFTVLGCRRAFSGVGFVGSAVCLRCLPYASHSAHATTALFCATLGCLALLSSGFKANYMDVTHERGGVVSGVGNTIASVASSVGPLVVSQVRASSGSWVPVFNSVALVNLLAALAFCTLSSATPVEADVPGPQALVLAQHGRQHLCVRGARRRHLD